MLMIGQDPLQEDHHDETTRSETIYGGQRDWLSVSLLAGPGRQFQLYRRTRGKIAYK